MSELETFRDHARRMAEAQHKPGCSGYRVRVFGGDELHPRGERCPGCVTDDDRALWARLADEVDAYLKPHAEEGLFA